MYKKSPDNISLELRASPLLALVFVLTHTGALIFALLLPLPVAVRVALSFTLLISLYRTLRQHVWRRGPNAVVGIASASVPGEYTIRFAGSNAHYAGKLMSRWLQPWLTILVVRLADRRWPVSVIIPADAVTAENFRRLRVQLRLNSAAE
ncbi:MAG: hypothetical protein HY308_09940 [Gammaproteobacteria bacterium]|nr:hypothetical protein [Gammaproteobacteria bacterium]